MLPFCALFAKSVGGPRAQSLFFGFILRRWIICCFIIYYLHSILLMFILIADDVMHLDCQKFPAVPVPNGCPVQPLGFDRCVCLSSCNSFFNFRFH